MVRLRHYDDVGTARFVTVKCHRHLRLLTREADILILLEEINFARRKYDFLLLAYVIMPNHFHLLLVPQRLLKLGPVIGEIKSKSARRILARWRDVDDKSLIQLQINRDRPTGLAFWLKRCYDRNCRTPDEVRQKLDYCHKNPVRGQLVEDPVDWPWSSYGQYCGSNNGLLRADMVHL